VTLTTDFGGRDPWVGIMKGVVLGIAPDARLVDVSHEIAPHDVLEGALALEAAAPFFPARCTSRSSIQVSGRSVAAWCSPPVASGSSDPITGCSLRSSLATGTLLP
jgi:hypothetical protein